MIKRAMDKKRNSASLVCDQPLLLSFHHTSLRLSTLPLTFFLRHSHSGNLNSSWLTKGKLTRGHDDFILWSFCFACDHSYIISQGSLIICIFKIIYSNTQITTWKGFSFLRSESCNVSYDQLNTQENTFSGHSRRISFSWRLCALLSSL